MKQYESKVSTEEIWEKHFGKSPSVGLSDNRITNFFNELSEEIRKEDFENLKKNRPNGKPTRSN